MRLINTANYDIKTLQERLVPILECIDNVCREHHLRYYLWAGTMLGAVRHKGFIPWDDDIDICMPRPDYEQLIQHCHKWISSPFEIVEPHNHPDYPYPFAKMEDSTTTVWERPDFKFLQGVFVDIFPIDGIPSDPTMRKKHMKKYKLWRHLLYLRTRDPFKHGRGPRSWWPLLIHQLFSIEGLQRRVHEVMTKYKFDEHEEVIDYSMCEDGIVRKEWLGVPVPYEFEGKSFMGISDADSYLTYTYGDYMTPPPKDKQIQHNFYYINMKQSCRDFKQLHNLMNK